MKLRKVISGGQTGADKTALEEAKALGLETGGTAPKGYRIDGGVDLSLKDYGLVESASADYPPRTKQNVRDSDATVWFGKRSPGYWCTVNACRAEKKTMHENPHSLEMQYICNAYEVLNVAGNRKRINPSVVGLVKAFFATVKQLKDGGTV